jgi:hypothetical protein
MLSDFLIHQADLREIDHPPEHSDDRFSVVIFKVEKIIPEWPPTRRLRFSTAHNPQKFFFSQLTRLTCEWNTSLHGTTLQVHEVNEQEPIFFHCQLHYVTRAD